MRVLHVYRTWYPDQPGGLPEAIRQFALAGALRALAKDPTACARFGAAARARYEACFAGSRLGDAWTRLYEEVRAARAAAAP